jgi:hypothetical protein
MAYKWYGPFVPARLGEKASTLALSRSFTWFFRRFTGMKDLPAADFFLVDRRVLDAFRQFEESNTNVLTLIAWMGFRQESLLYVKEARAHSKWSLEKKLKLAVDCITSFTYLPIRYMSYAGLIVAILGFLYAGEVLVTVHGTQRTATGNCAEQSIAGVKVIPETRRWSAAKPARQSLAAMASGLSSESGMLGLCNHVSNRRGR